MTKPFDIAQAKFIYAKIGIIRNFKNNFTFTFKFMRLWHLQTVNW